MYFKMLIFSPVSLNDPIGQPGLLPGDHHRTVRDRVGRHVQRGAGKYLYTSIRLYLYQLNPSPGHAFVRHDDHGGGGAAALRVPDLEADEVLREDSTVQYSTAQYSTVQYSTVPA